MNSRFKRTLHVDLRLTCAGCNASNYTANGTGFVWHDVFSLDHNVRADQLEMKFHLEDANPRFPLQLFLRETDRPDPVRAAHGVARYILTAIIVSDDMSSDLLFGVADDHWCTPFSPLAPDRIDDQLDFAYQIGNTNRIVDWIAEHDI